MSQYVKFTIGIGSSTGPFTIYYNQQVSSNIASIYVSPTRTTPATNLTFAQLTNYSNPLILVLPDSATDLILVDGNGFCQPAIGSIPKPTITPTNTPTPTVTPSNPAGFKLNLQWLVQPNVPQNMTIASSRIAENIIPVIYSFGTRLSITQPTLANLGYFPSRNVSGGTGTVSTFVNIPTITTSTATMSIYGSWIFPSRNVSSFNIKANLYVNGIYRLTTTILQPASSSSNTTIQYTEGEGLITVSPITLTTNDNVLIEYTI